MRPRTSQSCWLAEQKGDVPSQVVGWESEPRHPKAIMSTKAKQCLDKAGGFPHVYANECAAPVARKPGFRAVLALAFLVFKSLHRLRTIATVNGPISPTSLAEAILTLIWQNFVNI